MATVKEELDFLYKKKDYMNQTLLEKSVIEVLLKELCNLIPINKKITVNEFVKAVTNLNDTLNKHYFCSTNLVPKDCFLDYYINKADWLEFEELKKLLKIEKARKNLLEANDNYGWAEDCEVSEEEFIE